MVKIKSKVYEVYDEIIDWYEEHRNKNLMELEYLELITKSTPEGGSILDLGCGTGEPIAKFFIQKGFKITGVDGSKKMISRCRERFPNETWLLSNMSEINFHQKFDAIISWHSFFHLEHEKQRKMFQIFKEYIKPGGILAFTSGEEHGEVWSDNGGQALYHASLSTEEYEQRLKEASFQVLIHKVRDPNCGDATIWIAKQSSTA